MSKIAVNETEHYKSMSHMKQNPSIQSKLWEISDIYRKVNEVNGTSDEFLYNCYIDTLVETRGLIKFAFSCVRDGAFHPPRDYLDDSDDDDEDEDEDDDEDDDDYYNNRKMDREMNTRSFKNSIMDALLMVDKTRMKVAECLLARSNTTEYMELFYVYSRGAHRELGGSAIVTMLYKCLRHIHSGDIKFDYKFGDVDHALYRFDAMFCSKNTLADYGFFMNAPNSFDEQIVEFDPAITHHDKTKYATVRGFICATTGEAIERR